MPPLIATAPGTTEKLRVLTHDSQYDLACSCAPGPDEHRRRSDRDTWIYPVTMANGRSTFLFKTLLSNACTNDCAYCPLRQDADTRRCSLSPEELAGTFFAYYRARKVSGLFLSSAVTGDPDTTMTRINHSAVLLRRAGFRGYIHLKVIPGSSEAAIRHSLSLATAVSVNIEAPGQTRFTLLSRKKDYLRDVLGSIRLISRLTAPGNAYTGVKHTTQFVVGASTETDREIIDSSWELYKKWRLARVYFSAYQRGAGRQDLPGERSSYTNKDMLTREHRLYQVDWLMRKYGFAAHEIPVDSAGNLALDTDPKEVWAKSHPEFFPVNVNTADAFHLLRVPGMGQVMVDRILALRREGGRVRAITDLGRMTKLLRKAQGYVVF